MKKLILIGSFFLVVCNGLSQGLVERPAILNNANAGLQSYINYFHSIHYRNQFDSLLARYEALFTFRIDTTGHITNLNLETSMPLPDSVTHYMKELLFKTDRLWYPQVKNGVQVASDSIFVHFTIQAKEYEMKLLRSSGIEHRRYEEEFYLILEGKHPNKASYDRVHSFPLDKRNYYHVSVSF